MFNYEIRNDLNDQANVLLGWLLSATTLLAIPAAAITAALRIDLDGVVWGGTAAILAVAYLFRRVHRVGASSLAFLGGFLALFSIQLLRNGPNSAIYYLFLVPVIIATLLLDQNGVAQFAVLTIILMFGLTAKVAGIVDAFNFATVPCVVCGILAAIMYINVANTLDRIYWSSDIQKKDTSRAETFYQQREQLTEAMRELTHAKSRLELTNIKLAEATHMAERANHAKSIFMSNMSHELRTPLNVVIGYSSSMLTMPQMFDNTPLAPVHEPYVQLIEENGHYLVGLINDILDLSKIEAGKLELHCAAVTLPEIFRGVIATCTGLLKGKPLQIRPDYPDDLPMVWADPMRVRQIILNLISNAIKFTETGSVTLKAEVVNSFVRISVIDTGIGIPEKALATIFDRFQQAEHDTDKHYGGTGLGLDISKQLSIMHGGDLTVQSTVGQGSTFTFSLPLATETQVGDQPKSFGELQSAVTMIDTSAYVGEMTHAILIVEDEVSTREMMRNILEKSGYIVTDTHEGALALELAAGLLPSLIILDVNLPDISGWDILKQLKADPETSNIPVIISTFDEHYKLAEELGAALYLQKPVSAAAMLAGVQQILTPVLITNKEE